MLSAATMSAWAKSDREGGSLSLVRHLADSAAVAECVWDAWLPLHTRQLISHGLPGGERDGRLLLCWLAAVHDIGKLTPAFACQMPELADAMHAKGLTMPGALGGRKLLPHNLAGQVALEKFLAGHGWTKVVADTYSIVVGSHHGMPPTVRESVGASAHTILLGEGQWENSRTELLTFVTEKVGAAERLGAWREVALTISQQSLLTAAVIVTDWIASNQDLFPLNEKRVSSTAAPEAWRQLGLPGPWRPRARIPGIDQDRHGFIRGRFGWTESMAARPLQLECMRIAAAMTAPGLQVIEAPMGEGKTEAALIAAEILAQRFGLGGVFLALPTMATSDAMFGRVATWADRLPDTPSSMFLAHGRAALNPEFAALRKRGFASIGPDCADSGLVAHAWHVGKKGPLANIVVGTIDQVLRMALKTRHVMLRHLALANKVVVIDEVHAADSYMSTYLCRSLEWLGAYRVPVLLLSATLPPAQRRQLVQAYQRGRGDQGGHVPEETGYPRITVWPNPGPSRRVQASSRRIEGIRIEQISDDPAHVVSVIDDATARGGGVVGVVCNTVARAQEIYSALTDAGMTDRELLLAHSRFVASHRADLEGKLRDLLGPPNLDRRRPDRFVVVGTQVIEQSLDIDFDLLITDLAPMDLLLQRIGRLHRHPRNGRPPGLSVPRCLIRGVDWNVVPPEPVAGSRAVYRTARLLRAAAVLHELAVAAITVPEDVPGLVDAAYDDNYVAPEMWEDAMQSAENDWRDHGEDQRRRAESYLLSRPGANRTSLRGWLAAGVPDDSDGAGGQAQVRDAEDTIEAIVVQRFGDEIRALDRVPVIGGAVIPTETEPPSWLAKKVSACTIRLPAHLTRYGAKEKVIRALEDTWYPGWQKSHWLAGELVLELDEDGAAIVAGHHLDYDGQLGLLVQKRDAA
ncbi:CRISPR-associated helicase Cas3' [Nocardia cyriacigeorgica]|uniref:CRISPR-associated helicase Cas3' n=1 Tax=Nocardia cyriacigeorgica TaxID=135487 RepID=UPI0013BCD06B|nr:CRISPR-associated helicase Cas3' [Nocardia cyriacigeorgica]NEW51647.1 CRISPR-associated helicase Cas3' [Nocardia cyriacigeorgica]